jgi:hypothetical protein
MSCELRYSRGSRRSHAYYWDGRKPDTKALSQRSEDGSDIESAARCEVVWGKKRYDVYGFRKEQGLIAWRDCGQEVLASCSQV